MSVHDLPSFLRPSRSDSEEMKRADRSFALLIVSASGALIVALAAFVAILVAAYLAITPARASGEFACRGIPFVHAQDKAAFAKHAPNGTMRAILIEHAHLWDATEMRRLCDAMIAGEPAELTCLQGRRDWGAIVASVPASVRDASADMQREHLDAFRNERSRTRPHQRAIDHCVRIGAVEGIVQPIPGVEGD